MSKANFPFVAATLGLLFAAVVGFGAPGPGGEVRLPLLTLLLVAEVGFIVSLVGAGLGVQALRREGMRTSLMITVGLCAVLAIWLGLQGLALWPSGG